MHAQYLQKAIALAYRGMEEEGGGPFGALIVRDGQIIGEGWNRVTPGNDPTAHAEMVAIRNACSNIDDFRLNGATLYVSCQPCPMCLSAAYWARIEAIYYAARAEDAAAIGFDDQRIYDELAAPLEARELAMHYQPSEEASALLQSWLDNSERIEY